MGGKFCERLLKGGAQLGYRLKKLALGLLKHLGLSQRTQTRAQICRTVESLAGVRFKGSGNAVCLLADTGFEAAQFETRIQKARIIGHHIHRHGIHIGQKSFALQAQLIELRRLEGAQGRVGNGACIDSAAHGQRGGAGVFGFLFGGGDLAFQFTRRTRGLKIGQFTLDGREAGFGFVEFFLQSACIAGQKQEIGKLGLRAPSIGFGKARENAARQGTIFGLEAQAQGARLHILQNFQARDWIGGCGGWVLQKGFRLCAQFFHGQWQFWISGGELNCDFSDFALREKLHRADDSRKAKEGTHEREKRKPAQPSYPAAHHGFCAFRARVGMAAEESPRKSNLNHQHGVVSKGLTNCSFVRIPLPIRHKS